MRRIAGGIVCLLIDCFLRLSKTVWNEVELNFEDSTESTGEQ